MHETEQARYAVVGESIFFHRTKNVFHVSFVRRFCGCNIVSAKRKMKGWFTHSQKDEIIHYLKQKKIIT